MSTSTETRGEPGQRLKGTHLEDVKNPAALKIRRFTTVFVYEAPVRIWHWVNALAILVLCITGYFIASPPSSLAGEASDHYLMGLIRFLHFSAAYIFAVGFLGRFIWAFLGNIYAREMFFVPFWTREYWHELIAEVKVYLFLNAHPKKVIGHNPLAQFAIFWCFTMGSLLMILTGFALYSDGSGIDSWQGKLFGWVLPLMGGSLMTHTWHHLGMWLIILFVMIHIYTVTREDIMSRQTMMSAMINGRRAFRDDDPD